MCEFSTISSFSTILRKQPESTNCPLPNGFVFLRDFFFISQLQWNRKVFCYEHSTIHTQHTYSFLFDVMKPTFIITPHEFFQVYPNDLIKDSHVSSFFFLCRDLLLMYVCVLPLDKLLLKLGIIFMRHLGVLFLQCILCHYREINHLCEFR